MRNADLMRYLFLKYLITLVGDLGGGSQGALSGQVGTSSTGGFSSIFGVKGQKIFYPRIDVPS